MSKKGKIVLVDDEIVNLEYNSTVLEEHGYEIKTAQNSKETFELLKNYPADILILDIVLKNESGLDILKKLRSDNQYEHLVIVMITGQLKSSDEQANGLELGANGYITRPVQKREFLARIDAFMRHKETVEALRKSEERFRKIIDRNPDAILIVEQDGKIKFANSAAEDLFKLSMDILLKRIFGYPMVIGEHTEINIVRKEEENVVGEMRTIDIDWDDKETFLTSIRDITDKKILWEQLVKAKDKAEESERLKTAFLANMSHEIRTPMNSIIGFVDLLQDKEISGDRHDVFLSAIRKGSERLLHTINDIIEISRIESGIVSMTLTPISLNKTLENIVEIFHAEILNKELQIRLINDVPKELDYIQTDINKLESILSNLIKNAIKFTPFGSIEIGCSVKDSKVKFYVKDTGVGIHKENMEALFNRFVQVDDHMTKVYDGSGLGLAISKAYCTMLGGDISVKSTKGEGSKFTFTINHVMVESEDKDQQNVSSNETLFRDNKVLIAEDDFSNFEYLKTLLTKRNNEVLWAKNGTEAIKIYKENKNLDLILMDLRMPDLDGFVATKEIKKINKKVPIIAQTAYALAGDREKALRAGCDDYIAKPIKKDDLFKVLNRHLPKQN